MFRVDLNQNRLSRLSQKRFSELNLRERDHLQEWLANQPDALGEELLIIQKEFDGFDETRERLDLLALDKDGNLVVIENKLDDSGRDVTWQALKYTAYVSGLTKTQIVDIYQQYLDRYAGGGNAAVRICEFMEVEELEETVLNPGNDQRMIFIAANFRREVTATVLWLLSRGIRAQCFKVTPYAFGDELMVDIQQIIPTPEAADFMIGMAAKDIQENSEKTAQRRSHQVRREFWTNLKEAFAQTPCPVFPTITVTKDNWNISPVVAGTHYDIVLTQKAAFVKLSIERPAAAENKAIFDHIHSHREEIEADFGAALDWRRLPQNKVSRIEASLPCDGFNPDSWPEVHDWIRETSTKMAAAMEKHLNEAIGIARSHDE